MPTRLLITVGTTQFAQLTDQVQSDQFLSLLAECNISKVIIQVGKANIGVEGLDIAAKDVLSSLSQVWNDLPLWTSAQGLTMRVGILHFIPNLEQLIESADLIISHCGAGTAMEALKHMKALCLISNPNLSENHQAELGEALEAGSYASFIRGEMLREDAQQLFFDKVKVSWSLSQ